MYFRPRLIRESKARRKFNKQEREPLGFTLLKVEAEIRETKSPTRKLQLKALREKIITNMKDHADNFYSLD